MAITAAGTISATSSNTSGTTLSFTRVPANTGNVIVLFVFWLTSATVSVATASSGVLWTPGSGGIKTYTGITRFGQAFYGIAQNTTSGLATTLTFNVSNAGRTVIAQEYHSSLGAPVWSEVIEGIAQAPTASPVTSMPGPSYAAGTGNVNSVMWFTGTTGAATGTPAAYTFQIDGGTNVYGYNLSTTGTESPTANQSGAGAYDSIGMAMTDVAPTVQRPIPVISGYSGMFYHEENNAYRTGTRHRSASQRHLRRTPEQRPSCRVRSVNRSGLRQWERRGGVRIG